MWKEEFVKRKLCCKVWVLRRLATSLTGSLLFYILSPCSLMAWRNTCLVRCHLTTPPLMQLCHWWELPWQPGNPGLSELKHATCCFQEPATCVGFQPMCRVANGPFSVNCILLVYWVFGGQSISIKSILYIAPQKWVYCSILFIEKGPFSGIVFIIDLEFLVIGRHIFARCDLLKRNGSQCFTCTL